MWCCCCHGQLNEARRAACTHLVRFWRALHHGVSVFAAPRAPTRQPRQPRSRCTVASGPEQQLLQREQRALQRTCNAGSKCNASREWPAPPRMRGRALVAAACFARCVCGSNCDKEQTHLAYGDPLLQVSLAVEEVTAHVQRVLSAGHDEAWRRHTHDAFHQLRAVVDVLSALSGSSSGQLLAPCCAVLSATARAAQVLLAAEEQPGAALLSLLHDHSNRGRALHAAHSFTAALLPLSSQQVPTPDQASQWQGTGAWLVVVAAAGAVVRLAGPAGGAATRLPLTELQPWFHLLLTSLHCWSWRCAAMQDELRDTCQQAEASSSNMGAGCNTGAGGQPGAWQFTATAYA